MPARVQDAMQMQVEAERKKRAAILESEGIREADINVAEGKKRAKILSSGNMILYYFLILYLLHQLFNIVEADQQEQINQAQGEAQGLLSRAQARARSLELLSISLESKVSTLSLNLGNKSIEIPLKSSTF